MEVADFLYSYPDPLEDRFITELSEREEFYELRGGLGEPIPQRGQKMKHQKAAIREALIRERGLIMYGTGTGKSCIIIGLAEHYKNEAKRVLGDAFPNVDPMADYTHIPEIRRAYILVPGPSVQQEMERQLVCKCTKYGEYESDDLKGTTERGEKRVLTNRIAKFYTIITYDSFVNELKNMVTDEDRARMTPEQAEQALINAIQARFDNTLIMADEVHNLRTDIISGTEEVRQSYLLIQKAFRYARNTKIILFSATPMINSANDIRPILNLILPKTKELPADLDLDADQMTDNTLELLKTTLMKDVFVAFLRELDIGVDVRYMGSLIPETQTRIVECPMSEFQAQAYLRIDKEGFREREREAANFIFPDGSYGIEGRRRYAPDIRGGLVKIGQELMNQIAEYGVGRFSSKYAYVMRLLERNPRKKTFYYDEIVSGAGIKLFAALMQSVAGYDQFVGDRNVLKEERVSGGFCAAFERKERGINLTKKKRFAVLTSETTENQLQNILTLYNSYENRYGEYISLLIGSGVTQTGLNLRDVSIVVIETALWNNANKFQAISRAIRADSHITMIEEMRPEKPVVEIYQMAAVIPNGPKTVDEDLYVLSEAKERKIARVRRIIKRAAIDCYTNKERNVRAGDVDGSPVCDYTVCDYKCFAERPRSSRRNYSSYNLLYAAEEVVSVEEKIVEIFKNNPYLNIDQIVLYMEQEENVRKDITILALEQMLIHKKPFLNSFGFRSFLSERDGRLFLTYEYPSRPDDNSGWSGEYNHNLVITGKKTLEEYVNELQALQATRVRAETSESVLPYVDPTDPDAREKMDNAIRDIGENIVLRSQLFENAITKYYVERDLSDPYTAVFIDKYKLNRIHFIVPEQRQLMKLAKAPGKKGKKPAVAKKKSTTYSKDEILATNFETDMTNPVYIHILPIRFDDKPSLDGIYKADRARIMFSSRGDNQWYDIDTDSDEADIYKRLIFRKQLEMDAEIDCRTFCGIYDYLFEHFWVRDNRREESNRVGGRTCTTHDVMELAIAAAVTNADPGNLDRIPRRTRTRMIARIRERVLESKVDDETLNSFSDEILHRIMGWIDREPKVKAKDYCRILVEHFRNNNMLREI